MPRKAGVLVDIGHPAHVHVFKNVLRILNGRGIQTYVTARQKEVSLQLLDACRIPYQQIGTHRTGAWDKGLHAITRIRGIARAMRQHGVGVGLGVHNPYVAGAGKLARVKTAILIDSEPVRYDRILTYGLSSYLLTPRRFANDLGTKQVRFDGFKELAYLHPKYFTPEPRVLDALGVQESERFFLVRFVAWAAEHDIGQRGLSMNQKRRLVEMLSQYGKVFISSEGALPRDLVSYQLKSPPERLHDVLAYASLLFSESQTMTTEAALLGTPVVQTNSLVGTMSNFVELEDRYGLIQAEPNSERAIAIAASLAEDSTAKADRMRRRNRLFQDKIDVAEYLADVAGRVLDGNAPEEGRKR